MHHRLSHLLPVCLAIAAGWATLGTGANDVRSPVILVPGNGGSQLWAHLKGTDSPWYCRRRSTAGKLQQLWLEMSSLLYPAVNCLAYNLKLRNQPGGFFSPASTSDNSGVNTFVPGFGTVDTVMWISDWQSKYTAYFSTLVTHLENTLGYKKNFNIKGAPYDFRKAPDELEGYFESLKELIEDSYWKADSQKVVLVAHSLGAKLTLHFLHSQSAEWKAKYVGHFVAVGGAFGGVTVSLQALLTGYNLGIPLVDPLRFRPVQRSWPSTHYLLPDANVYDPDQPLVRAAQTPTQLAAVYSAANLSALFDRAGFAKGYADGRARYASLTDVRRPPGVATTCVFGDGLPTLSRIAWPSPGENGNEDAHEAGDGTVAAATKRVCDAWVGGQTAPVRVHRMEGAQHLAMLSDPRLLRLVAQTASGKD